MSRDSVLVERRTRDRKVASSIPGWSGGRIFFSRVNFACRHFFGVRSTHVLLQWHVKDPGHSAKSAGGRLHLNIHTPLTQQSRSGVVTMPLSWQSVETYPETSSHVICQGTLGHSRLSARTHTLTHTHTHGQKRLHKYTHTRTSKNAYTNSHTHHDHNDDDHHPTTNITITTTTTFLKAQ